MLLRRITQHVSQQNWTAVAIDFVIVVVGVFIGIQVSNWNESRTEKEQEAQFLKQLHVDIVLAESTVGTRMYRQAERFQAFALALGKVGADDPSPLTRDECTAMAGSFLATATVPILPSVEELRARNGLDLIRDVELKLSLAAMTQAAELIDSLVMNRLRFVTDPGPAYPDLIATRHYVDDTGEVRVLSDCDLPAMQNSQGFKNAMATNIDFQDTLTERVTDLLEAFGRLHERLDQLLDISHPEQAAARVPDAT